MPLPDPRKGEPIGFSLYPEHSIEFTIASPETVIWSSIRHFCSQLAGEAYLKHVHKIRQARTRSAVAANVKLYVQQASEFYHAAATAKPNTAPLFYYYAFLNLAKARCEIRFPSLHSRRECYAHGVSWRPDPKRVVILDREVVRVGRPGMWHLLWETIVGSQCPAVDPTRLPLKKLFALCPEIGVEYGTLFGIASRIHLNDINFIYDKRSRNVWLRFSISRDRLRDHGLSAPQLLAQLATPRATYSEVKSGEKEARTFESSIPATLRGSATPSSALRDDILALNLVAHSGEKAEPEYSITLQQRLPFPMPQLMVSYTILFWLGSLVRYDPHSVAELMDSPVWIMIEGFMTQSRLWLLQLFQWELFQDQVSLRTAW